MPVYALVSSVLPKQCTALVDSVRLCEFEPDSTYELCDLGQVSYTLHMP